MPAKGVRVEFTKHANEKLKIFRQHGLRISKKFVSDTVKDPELEDSESRKPLKIAISDLDSKHYLRVIYKQVGQVRKVITLYPARKGRYEGKI